MPIIKSAKKRVRTAAKAKSRNTQTKRTMREALKAFAASLDSGKSAEISKAQAAATSAIDKAAKKDVIHKNKAARKKAQLAAAAKAKGVKPAKAPAKATAKPAAPKKTAAKTPSKKKPAAKK